ncbi:immunoglobulin gamma-1 heavy chain-like [Scyliorhinus canicula]|uniref:immunoglobulin gamma-1 heavy chain-like n=1 Tax=Scyliorhinus canicula TaxID=7830 RepID=UPI0018F530D0|nr:immunoglobulin gamma-1 heavy chain-like [Scyliorhinus canicula]
MRWAISLSLLLTFLSRVQSDVVLTQPEAETGHPGCSLRLSCKTSGFDLGIYWMGWIRQLPGQGLDWLLWYDSTSNNNYAPGFHNRFTASKDLSNNIFSLAITRLKAEDTAIYYCVRYTTMGGFDFWGQGTMVTVISGTPSPPTLYSLVSSCQQQNTDGSVTYGCLAMDYSPEITSLTWKKDGQPITTGVKKYPSVRNNKGTYTLSSQLTITESEGGCSKISCEVRHSGSDKSIGMTCPPPVNTPNVLLTVTSSEEITRRKFATMVCSIVDFHPISMAVKWLKNGQPMTSGIITSPACEQNGNFSASSRLTVSAGEWFSRAIYTCQVTHQEVTQSQRIAAPAVQCEDQSSHPEQVVSREGDRAELNCRISIGTGDAVAWYRQAPTEAPTFIATIYQGTETKGRYTLSFERKKKSNTICIDVSAVQDSGMYLCAKQTHCSLSLGDISDMDVSGTQRQTISLHHNITLTTNDCVFWYRQFSNKATQNLVSTFRDERIEGRFKVSVDRAKLHVRIRSMDIAKISGTNSDSPLISVCA